MERICIYPGSFDPITLGHVDIIRRACRLFDRVVVGVLHNVAKKGCFSVEERLEMIRAACSDMPQVTAVAFDGLTVDLARKQGACAMVRGVRSIKDYESEMTLAQLNGMLEPDLETVLLFTRPEQACISSSALRELAAFGGDLSVLAPPCNIEKIAAKFAPKDD